MNLAKEVETATSTKRYLRRRLTGFQFDEFQFDERNYEPGRRRSLAECVENCGSSRWRRGCDGDAFGPINRETRNVNNLVRVTLVQLGSGSKPRSLNEHRWYQHEITRFIRVESVDSDYLHMKTSDDNIREAETLSWAQPQMRNVGWEDRRLNLLRIVLLCALDNLADRISRNYFSSRIKWSCTWYKKDTTLHSQWHCLGRWKVDLVA